MKIKTTILFLLLVILMFKGTYHYSRMEPEGDDKERLLAVIKEIGLDSRYLTESDSGTSVTIHKDETTVKASITQDGHLTSLHLTSVKSSKMQLKNFRKLENIEFFDCEIENLILSQLTQLIQISFSHTQLKKIDFAELKELKKLSIISILGLKKVILNDMENLNSLGLENCSISDLSLSKLPNLTTLYLINNPLKKVDLIGLSKLKVLNLSECRISDLALSHLPTGLQKLDLSKNREISNLYLKRFHHLQE